MGKLAFEKWILPCAMLAVGVLFFVYYPPIYAFRDEADYLSMAYILREGSLFIRPHDVPFSLYLDIADGYRTPVYPLGQSLVLLPLTYLGWKSVFLAGIGFHFLGFYFFRKLAHQFGITHPLAGILYLFFPAYVFYSRTLMADIPSATFILMGVYFYWSQSSRKAWAGVCFGLSLLFRFTNVIVIFPFFLVLGLRSLKSRSFKEIVVMSISFLPFVLIACALNTFYYGGPLTSGYSILGYGLDLKYLQANLGHYVVSLALVYPAMLFVPLLVKKTRKAEHLIAIVIVLFVYCLHYFQDKFPNPIANPILGTRYLFPVIPLFLLSYGEITVQLLEKTSQRLQHVLIYSILVAFLVMGIGLHHHHQQYLKRQQSESRFIYENTPEESLLIYDYSTIELIQKVWGERRYFRYDNAITIDEFLKDLNEPTTFYLITRELIYDGKPIPSLIDDDLDFMRQNYGIEEIGKHQGLTLYKGEYR